MQTAIAFIRDERGSYTIEFCLWIPVFLFFLAATIDGSMIYLTHNAMWNAARDTARRVTTGEFDDPDPRTTERNAEGHLWNQVTVYQTAMHPDVRLEGGEVIVTVLAPIRDVSPFGIFGFTGWWYGYEGDPELNDRALEATVTMRLEPNLV